MTIQDLASNPLVTQSSPMIGFTDPADVPDDLQLRIYFFLLDLIRSEDQKNGNQFLERYLLGPEEVWRANDQAIRNLPVLWDVANIPDRFLVFLKNIVGWTSELRGITDNLTFLTLRRLIRASVPFWKRRGPEDAIIDIMRLTTAARMRIWNWFDFRIVLDETGMGEEHQGRDPHMIALPLGADHEERTYNVRIVDDGTLDKALVRNLAKLTRPGNERVEISYLGFLDLFQVDADSSQWANEVDPFDSGGAPTTTVAVLDGVLAIGSPTDLQETFVDLPGSEGWTNYVATWRVKGSAVFGSFYRTANSDLYYWVLADEGNGNALILNKRVGGVFSSIATAFNPLGMVISPDVFYAIRVEATPEAGSTRIKVYLDAGMVIDVLDGSHAAGTLGFLSNTNEIATLDELEMFFNPLQGDFIDINS